LLRREESLDRSIVRALPVQLSSITGDLNPFPALKPMPVPFTLDNGAITLMPAQLTIGDGEVGLSGASSADGKLRMVIGVTSPQLRAGVTEFATGTSLALAIPLTGTAAQPTLNLDAMLRTLPADPARKLSEWINRPAARHFRPMKPTPPNASDRRRLKRSSAPLRRPGPRSRSTRPEG